MQGRLLTEDEAQAFRGRLAAAALGLVEREGREACSLRRVAAELGVSRTTPYTYFRSKEALLDAVRIAALELLAAACAEALRAETLELRLRGVGRAYVGFALGHPALYDLMFEPSEASIAHEEAVARYRALAEAPLREAWASGRVGVAPERLAHVLWAATHGAIGLHRAGKLRHGVALEPLLQDLGDVLAFGYVPRGAP